MFVSTKENLFDVILSKLQRMRETPVSSCEKNFLLEVSTNTKVILIEQKCASSCLELGRNDLHEGDHKCCQALWEGRRLDGRGWMDTRDLSVSFGSDWGSCQVAGRKVFPGHPNFDSR